MLTADQENIETTTDPSSQPQVPGLYYQYSPIHASSIPAALPAPAGIEDEEDSDLELFKELFYTLECPLEASPEQLIEIIKDFIYFINCNSDNISQEITDNTAMSSHLGMFITELYMASKDAVVNIILELDKKASDEDIIKIKKFIEDIIAKIPKERTTTTCLFSDEQKAEMHRMREHYHQEKQVWDAVLSSMTTPQPSAPTTPTAPAAPRM